MDAGADRLKARLDSETFTEVTERSTKALLTALGRIDGGIREVKDEIRETRHQQQLAEQRRGVGRGA